MDERAVSDEQRLNQRIFGIATIPAIVNAAHGEGYRTGEPIFSPVTEYRAEFQPLGWTDGSATSTAGERLHLVAVPRALDRGEETEDRAIADECSRRADQIN